MFNLFIFNITDKVSYHTIALISHISKVMLKILQARLQQYMNCELPDVQSGFRKGRGTRDQIANIKLPSSKKQESSEKHLLLLYWLCQSFWLYESQQTGKFLKKWEYQTIWPASWEICMQVKKQQWEQDMEQQTGSKSGKEYTKAAYGHPAYLTYMQSTSCKMPGWMKHKLESVTLEVQMTPPLWQTVKKNKEPFDESERGEWKSWLKAQHLEN